MPRLVGMVHLAPLPGAPRFEGDFHAVVDDAVARAVTLAEAGFPALMVENFGDSPFFATSVPAVTVAALTVCAGAIRRETGLPLGVNVLRNNATAALAVAAAVDAAMIRVNVLTGMMFTDQGPVTGRAAEVVRLRSQLCPASQIWADVLVKHASPPPGLSLEQAAADTWERGGADALILSGSGTGHAPDIDEFHRVRAVVPQAPLVVGSGATPDDLEKLAEPANHVVVGTALEKAAVPGAPLDPERVARFMEVARSAGLL